MACIISQLIKPAWIIANLKAQTKEALLLEMAQYLALADTGIDVFELNSKLLEREKKASTGADLGLAIPHAVINSTDKLLVALGISQHGIDFGALDNEKSKFFFIIVSPAKPLQIGSISYLHVISAICKLMRSSQLRNNLMSASAFDSSEVYNVLSREECELMPLPLKVASGL